MRRSRRRRGGRAYRHISPDRSPDRSSSSERSSGSDVEAKQLQPTPSRRETDDIPTIQLTSMNTLGGALARADFINHCGPVISDVLTVLVFLYTINNDLIRWAFKFNSTQEDSTIDHSLLIFMFFEILLLNYFSLFMKYFVFPARAKVNIKKFFDEGESIKNYMRAVINKVTELETLQERSGAFGLMRSHQHIDYQALILTPIRTPNDQHLDDFNHAPQQLEQDSAAGYRVFHVGTLFMVLSGILYVLSQSPVTSEKTKPALISTANVFISIAFCIAIRYRNYWRDEQVQQTIELQRQLVTVDQQCQPIHRDICGTNPTLIRHGLNGSQNRFFQNTIRKTNEVNAKVIELIGYLDEFVTHSTIAAYLERNPARTNETNHPIHLLTALRSSNKARLSPYFSHECRGLMLVIPCCERIKDDAGRTEDIDKTANRISNTITRIRHLQNTPKYANIAAQTGTSHG